MCWVCGRRSCMSPRLRLNHPTKGERARAETHQILPCLSASYSLCMASWKRKVKMLVPSYIFRTRHITRSPSHTHCQSAQHFCLIGEKPAPHLFTPGVVPSPGCSAQRKRCRQLDDPVLQQSHNAVHAAASAGQHSADGNVIPANIVVPECQTYRAESCSAQKHHSAFDNVYGHGLSLNSGTTI